MAERIVRLEVVDADPLRRERLVRSLKRKFDSTEGVSAGYADDEYGAPVPAGAKGAILPDILELTAVWGWPLAAPLVAEAVKSWLRRERTARVRVTVGFDHVEIEGDPTAVQERILLALLTDQDKA